MVMVTDDENMVTADGLNTTKFRTSLTKNLFQFLGAKQ